MKIQIKTRINPFRALYATALPLVLIAFLTASSARRAHADDVPVVEITVTPQTAGTYTTICDHFCGANHGNMNMTIVVE